MIVGMIPTYKEGLLARDAIHSILPICKTVVVFEGPITGASSDGLETDLSAFRKNQKVIVKHGEWKNEAAKRNAMLSLTRRFPKPTWGIFLDADEILLWAEYLETYIEYCDSQAAEGHINVACPILRVELDGSVHELKRLIRLDMLETHILASSQWKFFSSDIAVTFPSQKVERQPFQGEPHVLHRAFLRPKKRGQFRLSEIETDDFKSLERDFVESIGMPNRGEIPKIIDKPEIIIAQEVEQ